MVPAIRIKIEVWIVDLESKFEEGGKENMMEYYQGFSSKTFEISAPADDKVELTYEMAIDGNGVISTKTHPHRKPKISH